MTLHKATIRLLIGIPFLWFCMGCGDDEGEGISGPEIGSPTSLAFTTAPAGAALGDPITPAVQVAIQDSSGTTVPDATASVALSIEMNPGGGRLSGTTTVDAVDGIAVFDDLAIDRSGAGYTLAASAPGLSGAVSEPFDVRFVLEPVDIHTTHACGTSPGGLGYCWGDNGVGELGTGQAGPASEVPVRIAGGLGFTTVETGDNHSCALTPAGEAYCWGWDTEGQRGDGQAGVRDTVATPAPVVGGLAFAMITAGSDFNCGLTADGAGHCWGENDAGQLGTGTLNLNGIGEPTPIETDLRFDLLTAGRSHACGIATDGSAHCWGDNDSGELGDGNAGGTRSEPVPVAGGLGFVALSAGSSHTCGITGDGSAYCWGANVNGELGDSNAPTDSDVPSAVQGGHSFSAVSAGESHTCGITVAGEAFCWGFNGQGQLGDGNTGTSTDLPVAVLGGLSFEGVAAGEGSTCAWTPDGTTYCWGANGSGELGNGEAGIDSDRPVRVADPK